MRAIHKAIIHCAATPNFKVFDRADIDRWHKERGWSGIGYHYVIRVDGVVELGRPEEKIGAHCKGHNKDSIGICMIGTDEFTPEQWKALKALRKTLKAKYSGISFHGHNEFSEKECPGFIVSQINWHDR